MRSAPLLRGRLAADARATLGELSARFLRLRPSDVPDVSLAGGLCGIALAHASLDRLGAEESHRVRAERALAGVIRRLARTELPPGLHTGAAGLGWVVAQLVEPGADDADDLFAAFDTAVGDALAGSAWTDPFDLISGLAGLGVYALARVSRARSPGRRLLAAVVDHLAATARRRRPGIAWWSDPSWLRPSVRPTPNLDWNLGVAHGVPGVIAFLGLVVSADVDARTRTIASRLLDGAVAWLLAQELPSSAGGCFAQGVARGVPRHPARLGWCYGDSAIAAALLLAARAKGEPEWESAAIRIALRAAARPEGSTGVVDAGLCHGAAGVAHIFHRLYRATGIAPLAGAARRWFARALAMRVAGRGFAGFLALGRSRDGKLGWQTDPSFLTGAAGITLALVAATTDEEPSWDRALLLS